MTDAEYKKLFKILVGAVSKKGYGYLAEDIAQEYMVRMVTAGREPKLSWVIADVLRSEHGRTVVGKKKIRRRTMVWIDKPDESGEPWSEQLASEFVHPMPDEGVERFEGLFLARDRQVFRKLYLEEKLMKAVGAELGVSEACISLLKKKIDVRLTEAILEEAA